MIASKRASQFSSWEEMAKVAIYKPGGDAKVIQAAAQSYYGSYTKMFEAHDWPERGNKLLAADQKRVVEVYESVSAFEQAHLKSGDMLFPIESNYMESPNVWLTSFYGFRPETWGFVGFSDEARRANFLRRTASGVLVVIYGAGKAPKDMLGKVVGVLQCSHEIGDSEEFLAPAEWVKKQADPMRKNKWNFAVRAVRAWRVVAESRPLVRSFAPDATATEAWQHIGALGELLNRREAANILKLRLQEVSVYRQPVVEWSEQRSAVKVLAPSKAGPVSKTPHVVREAEGPKHIYVLRLLGNADACLGEKGLGHCIIKVGMSCNPDQRCADDNRHLPRGAFKWEVWKSGPISGLKPYPSSEHALAGEHAVQQHLCKVGNARSLDQEFSWLQIVQSKKPGSLGMTLQQP